MDLLPSFTGKPEENRVYHVDALTLLGAMEDKSVDCIVVDLPYGINKEQATWDQFIPLDWIGEAWRVSSRMLVMCGNPEFIQIAPAIGRVKNCVVLNARNGMTRSQIGFGNWIAVLVCGEWKWRPAPNHIAFNIDVTEKINHPSPKPLEAMHKLLHYYTDKNDLILDCFAGSGTTLVAARNLGRRYIGCDLHLPYVEICRQRLSLPYTPQMFENTVFDMPVAQELL